MRPKYKQAFREACDLLAIVYGACPNEAKDWSCSEVCPALQDTGRCWEIYFLHPDGDPARPLKSAPSAAREATTQ